MNARDSSHQMSVGVSRLGNEGIEGFSTKMENGFQGTDLREALEIGVIPVTEQDINQNNITAEQMKA